MPELPPTNPPVKLLPDETLTVEASAASVFSRPALYPTKPPVSCPPPFVTVPVATESLMVPKLPPAKPPMSSQPASIVPVKVLLSTPPKLAPIAPPPYDEAPPTETLPVTFAPLIVPKFRPTRPPTNSL